MRNPRAAGRSRGWIPTRVQGCSLPPVACLPTPFCVFPALTCLGDGADVFLLVLEAPGWGDRSRAESADLSLPSHWAKDLLWLLLKLGHPRGAPVLELEGPTCGREGPGSSGGAGAPGGLQGREVSMTFLCPFLQPAPLEATRQSRERGLACPAPPTAAPPLLLPASVSATTTSTAQTLTLPTPPAPVSLTCPACPPLSSWGN